MSPLLHLDTIPIECYSACYDIKKWLPTSKLKAFEGLIRADHKIFNVDNDSRHQRVTTQPVGVRKKPPQNKLELTTIQHLIALRPMDLQKEQFVEWEKELPQRWFRMALRRKGTRHCKAIAIYGTYLIRWRMAKRHRKKRCMAFFRPCDSFGVPVECKSINPKDEARLHQLGDKMLPGNLCQFTFLPLCGDICPSLRHGQRLSGSYERGRGTFCTACWHLPTHIDERRHTRIRRWCGRKEACILSHVHVTIAWRRCFGQGFVLLWETITCRLPVRAQVLAM